MLYQKLLTGEAPYRFFCGCYSNDKGFQEHRHPEVEFIYCKSGSFDIKIERQVYTVTEGKLVIVAPMEAHELFYNSSPRQTAVIEVGPLLLRTKFNAFSEGRIISSVKNLDDSTDNTTRLREVLEETIEIYNNKDEFSELIIKGNIYKICGYILSEFADNKAKTSKDMKSVANIEKALELIYNRYAEQLTVEKAASITGYGKSNFCKIFKRITGETFHSVLNRQRIENACIYLDETTIPISNIASAVGFTETKSFCRVFKSLTGVSPGERRKNKT